MAQQQRMLTENSFTEGELEKLGRVLVGVFQKEVTDIFLTDDHSDPIGGLRELLEAKYPYKAEKSDDLLPLPSSFYDATRKAGPWNWPDPEDLNYDATFTRELYVKKYEGVMRYEYAIDLAIARFNQQEVVRGTNEVWDSLSSYNKDHKIFKSYKLIEGNPTDSGTSVRDSYWYKYGYFKTLASLLVAYYNNQNAVVSTDKWQSCDPALNGGKRYTTEEIQEEDEGGAVQEEDVVEAEG